MSKILNMIHFTTGSEKEKVEPFPTSLLTHILPPDRLIIKREIYSPNPSPGVSDRAPAFWNF